MRPPRPQAGRPFSAEDLAVIDRFRGAPRNPVRKTRRPRDLSPQIDGILSSLRVGGDSPERVILENWRGIAGADRADRCAPARLQRDGTLVVLAPNPVLRQELSFGKRAMIAKIRRLPGCGFVRAILLRGG